MLSFEEIEDCFPNGAVSLPDGWIGVTAQWMHDLAHAIEAAVLPEGYVAVPKMPSQEDIIRITEAAYGPKLTGPSMQQQALREYISMINCFAAAPKPAQAEKQEPNCGHESCDCRGYCEKQEPVKDEPVFEVGFGWLQDADKFGRGTNLYPRPQDLTAEVERLKAERDSFYMDYRMKCDLETKQQAERIAELEAQDTEMCDVHAQLLVEHGKAKLHIAALEEAAREAREKQ